VIKKTLAIVLYLLVVAAPAVPVIAGNLGSVTAGSLNAVSISGGTISGTTISGVTIVGSSSVSGATITGGSIDIKGGTFEVSPTGFLTTYNATIENGMTVNGGMQINSGAGGFSNTLGTDSSVFVRFSKFSGTGNASLCVDSGGLLYRGSPGC